MDKSKACAHCGRDFSMRKKWEKNWDEVKYCSERCRRERKSGPQDEDALLALLKERSVGKTICPSEILSAAEKQDKERMEQVRQAARRLVHLGKIEITQKGKRVDPSEFHGPIRLRLVDK